MTKPSRPWDNSNRPRAAGEWPANRLADEGVRAPSRSCAGVQQLAWRYLDLVSNGLGNRRRPHFRALMRDTDHRQRAARDLHPTGIVELQEAELITEGLGFL